MKYVGSKNRIAKYILSIMLRERKPKQWWVEPFVGGANMIDKVEGARIGADLNPHVISALISIRDFVHELPKSSKEFNEENYKKLKQGEDHKHKDYIGFACSYGGKWFGGWCRSRGEQRDFVAESYRNAMRQSLKLQGVKFIQSSYQNLKIPKNSFIYCDPPYQGLSGYGEIFNHEMFWDWCRAKTIEGHIVFISEHSAPKDFRCVWEKPSSCTLNHQNVRQKRIEKLFKLKK